MSLSSPAAPIGIHRMYPYYFQTIQYLYIKTLFIYPVSNGVQPAFLTYHGFFLNEYIIKKEYEKENAYGNQNFCRPGTQSLRL